MYYLFSFYIDLQYIMHKCIVYIISIYIIYAVYKFSNILRVKL